MASQDRLDVRFPSPREQLLRRWALQKDWSFEQRLAYLGRLIRFAEAMRKASPHAGKIEAARLARRNAKLTALRQFLRACARNGSRPPAHKT